MKKSRNQVQLSHLLSLSIWDLQPSWEQVPARTFCPGLFLLAGFGLQDAFPGLSLPSPFHPQASRDAFHLLKPEAPFHHLSPSLNTPADPFAHPTPVTFAQVYRKPPRALEFLFLFGFIIAFLLAHPRTHTS